MPKLRFNLVQPMLGHLRIVCMAIMIIPPTRAHLMATTVLNILMAGSSLAQDRGSTVSTAAATVDGVATTVAALADGAAMVAASTVEAATTVVVDIMAEVDGTAVVDSAGTKASTAAGASKVAASVAVTGFMVAAASTVAVAADPTGEAADSSSANLFSDLNGWQPKLPAVFFCF